jgi:hypothetical protein
MYSVRELLYAMMLPSGMPARVGLFSISIWSRLIYIFDTCAYLRYACVHV